MYKKKLKQGLPKLYLSAIFFKICYTDAAYKLCAYLSLQGFSEIKSKPLIKGVIFLNVYFLEITATDA